MRTLHRWAGPLGGAPYGAANCARGVPKWASSACGLCHWGLRWRCLTPQDPPAALEKGDNAADRSPPGTA
eukprot:2516046-Pyramimonas_sp.AAC.1